MKLMTEMQDGCVHVGGCCIDDSAASSTVSRILQHDAACAHALMLAMQEQGDHGYVYETQKKAEELLREWVFDSGEVD